MIKFIKNLFGFGSADSNTPKETVKEILTPPSKTEVPAAVYISPTKPNSVARVRAISETGPEAVKAAHAQKSANKKRRPYRGNKNAGGTVAKITEGASKGGNTVKPAQVAKAKPVAPKAPVAKKK